MCHSSSSGTMLGRRDLNQSGFGYAYDTKSKHLKGGYIGIIRGWLYVFVDLNSLKGAI